MATLSLGKLIGGDPVSLKALEKGLEVDGWVFVNLESSFTEQISQIAPQLLHFFNNTSMPEKFKHTENVVGGIETDGPVYGYNSDAPRKEGIRLLTNSRLSSRWLPKSCPSLSSFSETMHQAMVDLVSSISPHLFSCSAEEVGAKWEVPMLRGKGNPKGDKNGPGEGRFGMFDVAYYFNSSSFKLPNCKEHSDPGLLSLSVASTERGLQLFRRGTGEWVDAPTGVGNSKAVLWGGTLIETITNGRLKSGIHRVINYPESPPRMSMWIECVTENQDLALMAPLLSQQPADPVEQAALRMRTLYSGANAVNTPSAVNSFPQPEPQPQPQLELPHRLEVLMATSHESGIPMSKSGLPISPFPQLLNTPSAVNSFPQPEPQPQLELPHRLEVLMATSHESGIPMSKSGLPISRGPQLEPLPQLVETKNNNQLKLQMADSKKSGIPLSKKRLVQPAPPPRSSIPQQSQKQQQQPEKTNTKLEFTISDSHLTGIPLSKRAPPPALMKIQQQQQDERQQQEQQLPDSALELVLNDSHLSGVPMSKIELPDELLLTTMIENEEATKKKIKKRGKK